MTAGQLVQGVVKNIDNVRKVVYLTTDRDMVSKCVVSLCYVGVLFSNILNHFVNFLFDSSLFEIYLQMKDLKGFSLDLLVPGMMVNARIQSTLENGIMLSFLTYFTGTVCIMHLCFR